MKRFSKTHGLRHCTGGRADRRGSAILLVLVAMVLMSILAGSLLQLTRFERIPRSESNIEVVIASVVDEILNQATDDLINNTGKFLSPAYNATNGGGDEPWDFPWTNDSISGLRTFDDNDGNPVAGILGGLMDDTWLAVNAPDFGAAPAAGTVYGDTTIAPTGINASDGTNGVWRKITSLTGVYLGGDANGNADLSLNAEPEEFAVTSLGVPLRSDTNINTTSDLLVDADGDGIGDSRWEWAPLRQVGATQYVMAVRIIDLSARVDVNVALGSTRSPNSNADITLNQELPRGDGPTELDGAAFAALLTVPANSGVTVAQARSDWRRAIEYRFTGNAGATGTVSAYPYDGAGNRLDYWEQGASRVSNTFGYNGVAGTAAFGLADAFELLQGNGLNSANNTTLETLMPNITRDSTVTENGYGAGAGTPPNSWSREDFWQLDPRKQMTVFSGSMPVAHATDDSQDRKLKIDLNAAVAAGNIDQVRSRIFDTITNSTNRPAFVGLFPHLGNIPAVSDQLAANIADYIDDDNTLTLVGSKAGFEALPHITEVYIQRPYSATTVTPGSDVVGNFIDVEWDPATNSTTGYAIEIGNPFGRLVGGTWVGRPVSLENVWLKLGSTAEVELSAITGAPTELAPGEVIIVTQDSTGGDATLDVVSSFWASPSGAATIVASVNGPAMPDGDVTVSLHAEDQANPGSALTWFYSACEINTEGGTIDEEIRDGAGDFTTAVGDTTYIQANYRGIGEGLRMMTVHPKTQGGDANPRGFNDLVSTLTEPSLNRDDLAGTAVRNTVTPEFSSAAKTGASTAFAILDDQQIVWPDSERERLHWVGDLLQIPLIGPNPSGSGNLSTLAAVFNASGMDGSAVGIADLMLSYQRYSGTAVAPLVRDNTSTAQNTGQFGVYNYPHALLLLEQFTTYNPAMDGVNGDGSNPADAESVTNNGSGDNDNEVLVPGKLNLNTASFDTLVRLLPFPEVNTRINIANAIIERRESMDQETDFGLGSDDIPGIAYTSALYEQIENRAVNPSQVGGDNTTVNPSVIDSAGNVTAGADDIRIDLNDYEDRGALNDYDPSTVGVQYPGLADGVANDREEEIMLAKWLSEMTDTRSDVFAAYIIVQGYPVDNFTDGATESARLIVIFSRAGVKDSTTKAVEIGRFRIN